MIVRTTRRTLSMLLAGGALAFIGHPLNAQEKSTQIEYVERGRPVTPGQAPGMKVKDLGSTARMFQVTFTKGDEVMSGLTDFAEKNNIKAAHFTAVGAFSSALLGWGDPGKGFRKITLDQEAEVVSFSGGIAPDKNGKPVVHAHVVVALPDGSAKAGHVFEGHVGITMEVFIIDAGDAAAKAGQ